MARNNHQQRQKRNLTKIPAINPGIADKLIAVGIVTISHLKTATDEQLLAVAGINEGKLAEIRAYCAGS